MEANRGTFSAGGEKSANSQKLTEKIFRLFISRLSISHPIIPLEGIRIWCAHVGGGRLSRPKTLMILHG